MKIGVDLRFLGADLYSQFVMRLLNELVVVKNDARYIFYTNDHHDFVSVTNLEIKRVDIALGSLKEQTTLKNIFTVDKPNLMLFFHHAKPVFYKKNYISFVGSLKDIYYSDFPSNLSKSKYLYLTEKNFKNSKKIICLDEKTKHELIERFDIHEEKIATVNGFFPHKKSYELPGKIDVYINTKYGITSPYFIYSGGNSIEKNYEKLISVLHKLRRNGQNLSLVILGNTVSKNIELRAAIVEKNLQDYVHFLGSPEVDEKRKIYHESLGVIFPSFYEPFPFRLAEPLYFNTPILASNLEKIQKIFGDTIHYFSPISENSIIEAVEKFLKKGPQAPDFESIKNTYKVEHTVKELIEVINKS